MLIKCLVIMFKSLFLMFKLRVFVGNLFLRCCFKLMGGGVLYLVWENFFLL